MASPPSGRIEAAAGRPLRLPPPLLESSAGPPADEAKDRWLSAEVPPLRWVGWRVRLLVALVLLACLGMFSLAQKLAAHPHMGATLWRDAGKGRLELLWAEEAAVRSALGRQLLGLSTPGGPVVPADALLLQRSARWLVDDESRERYLTLNEQAAAVLREPVVRLHFADRPVLDVALRARGLASLGLLFWLSCGLALALLSIAATVVLAHPGWRTALFSVMAFSQAGQLLLIGIAETRDLAWPAGLAHCDQQLRYALDLITAAAALHACVLSARQASPVRLSWAVAGWVVAAMLALPALLDAVLPAIWWWVQGGCAALGLLAVIRLQQGLRQEPHPFVLLLRRVGMAAWGAWVLLSAGVAWAGAGGPVQQAVTTLAPPLWHVLLASLLAIFPFLSRSRGLMRSFSWLAALTVATAALDLLFVSTFALGHATSLTLALFLSLGLYLGTRHWLIERVIGKPPLSTERLFERLYRIAREVEQQPQRTAELLERLLRELFEPLETLRVRHDAAGSRVTAGGSSLVVPVPLLSGTGVPPEERAIVLRYARHGRRLFTAEDARLTDRIFEQLGRAVAYERAVERGRNEERMRLAQDLHDDIGARLLTLMYKASTPEMEDYIRHTLQDLKTLTRGLAAREHHLRDAAAEWKTDLQQRLAPAGCELVWHFEADRELCLGTVQWSALTRMLRELTSNALAHGKATRLEISLRLANRRLDLIVRDNGHGNAPATWSHGLGIGGVHKRVHQLGGQVGWRALAPHGIECHVAVEPFG